MHPIVTQPLLTLAPDITEIFVCHIQFFETIKAYDFSLHGDEQGYLAAECISHFVQLARLVFQGEGEPLDEGDPTSMHTIYVTLDVDEF